MSSPNRLQGLCKPNRGLSAGVTTTVTTHRKEKSVTSTLVRPAQIIFEEPKPKRRYRMAAIAAAVVGAGAVALGIASLNDAPALPAEWPFPTSIEELVDSGLVPVESLGDVAVDATKWAIPTSIDDLIESGFDPTS